MCTQSQAPRGVLVFGFEDSHHMRIDGERAQILLTMLDETTSQRQPIHYADFRVVLTRSDSARRPTEVRLLAES